MFYLLLIISFNYLSIFNSKVKNSAKWNVKYLFVKPEILSTQLKFIILCLIIFFVNPTGMEFKYESNFSVLKKYSKNPRWNKCATKALIVISV